MGLPNKLQREQGVTSITLSPQSNEILRYVEQSLSGIQSKGSEITEEQTKNVLQVQKEKQSHNTKLLYASLFLGGKHLQKT